MQQECKTSNAGYSERVNGDTAYFSFPISNYYLFLKKLEDEKKMRKKMQWFQEVEKLGYLSMFISRGKEAGKEELRRRANGGN